MQANADAGERRWQDVCPHFGAFCPPVKMHFRLSSDWRHLGQGRGADGAERASLIWPAIYPAGCMESYQL